MLSNLKRNGMLDTLDSEVLLNLSDNKYPSAIAKDLGITFGSCYKHLISLEKKGLIIIKKNNEKDKRVLTISLTRSGQVIQEHLLVVKHILSNPN